MSLYFYCQLLKSCKVPPNQPCNFPLECLVSVAAISKMPNEGPSYRFMEMLFVICQGDQTEHAEFQVCCN